MKGDPRRGGFQEPRKEGFVMSLFSFNAFENSRKTRTREGKANDDLRRRVFVGQ